MNIDTKIKCVWMHIFIHTLVPINTDPNVNDNLDRATRRGEAVRLSISILNFEVRSSWTFCIKYTIVNAFDWKYNYSTIQVAATIKFHDPVTNIYKQLTNSTAFIHTKNHQNVEI